jgi:hypothetical protein
MIVEANCEVESVEEVSVAVLGVDEALVTAVWVEFAVLALQKENVPVDFNNALDARSITRLATTPGFEDKRSSVWEKCDEASCVVRVS